MMQEEWAKPTPAELREAVDIAIEDLDSIQNELFGGDRLFTTGDRFKHIDYWGTRGATRKRQAEVEFLTGSANWRVTLRAAQADYEQGLQAGYSDHWILGQFVVLRSVLASAAKVEAAKADDRWEETCRAVRLGIKSGVPTEQMWAWSSLADLCLVAAREHLEMVDMAPGLAPTAVRAAVGVATSSAVPETARVPNVRDVLAKMVSVVGGPDHCPALWPTFRQFWRWQFWWQDEAWAHAAHDGYEFLRELVVPRLPVQVAERRQRSAPAPASTPTRDQPPRYPTS
jgi:hypothetical protein